MQRNSRGMNRGGAANAGGGGGGNYNRTNMNPMQSGGNATGVSNRSEGRTETTPELTPYTFDGFEFEADLVDARC
ncbi:unnamed protein product [Amoebophrya sp. A25]|nr:unnamed protein product [Amoebophrya sp. A25]|eukprot:GSA25T00020006001.1